MSTENNFVRLFRTILLMAVGLATALYSPAQQVTIQSGIEHYRSSRYSEAVSVFRSLSKSPAHQGNADVWNYLGLAYLQTGDSKDARKAFQKAVGLQPGNPTFRVNLATALLIGGQIDKSQSEARAVLKLEPKNTGAFYVLGTGYLWEGKIDDAMRLADEMINIDPTFPNGYILKYEIMIASIGRRKTMPINLDNEAELFGQAVSLLETGLAKSGKHPLSSVLAENLRDAKVFHTYFANRKDRAGIDLVPTPPEPGVTPFKLISKPKASYTDAARNKLVQGSIRLAVLLGANGKIGGIIKLSSLGYGLDEQAIRAARGITFTPKMKDGKPVDTIVTMEYSFSMY